MKSRLSLAAAALLALLLSSCQAQSEGKAAPPTPTPLCDPTHLTSAPLTFSLPAMCSCIFSLNKKITPRKQMSVCELICLN